MSITSESKRVAYLVNVYPAPSHSFIRREILALEELGWEVVRFSIRRTESPLHDVSDQRESEKTDVLLDAGVFRFVLALILRLMASPIRFIKAATMAWHLGRISDVGVMKHGIYLAESCYLCCRLRGLNVRHLHAHFGTNSATVALLCFLVGGPKYSFTAHGPEEFDKPTVLGLTEKINHAAFVVAISQFGRSQLYRWTAFNDWSKIHVVHCGLDREFLDAPTTPVPDNQRLLCVGRLCEQKGQLLLVEAFAKIINASKEASPSPVAEFAKIQSDEPVAEFTRIQGDTEVAEVARLQRENGTLGEFRYAEVARLQPSRELVLVGDGPMRAQIEDRIRALGIEHGVRIIGWASGETVRKEIEESRVFVLPSFAEGLPVVIMEAMALVRPVISTYVAGIPELVIPGENGWLVHAGDVDALVLAINDSLSCPQKRMQEMGELGRDRVREQHDIDVEVNKLAIAFMNELL